MYETQEKTNVVDSVDDCNDHQFIYRDNSNRAATEAADGADLVISTLEDLKAFSAAVDSGDAYSGKTVVLNNNIDASADDWNPIGTDAAAFSGTFDAQGNAVTIKINTENTYQGFFAKNAGIIKNLSVKGSIVGKSYLGGIAGYSNNEGKFTNCYNMGNIQSGDSKDSLATVYLNEEIFVNCYYLADKENASNANKVAKTAAAFENGEIAQLLGDSFSQQIGIDKHPVLTEKVDECFIATAAYGSKFQPAVVLLRKFRDRDLLTNSPGTKFVQFYYKNSPPIARFIAENEPLKFIVRALLTPIVCIVYLISHPVLMGIALALVLILVRWKFRKVIHA